MCIADVHSVHKCPVLSQIMRVYEVRRLYDISACDCMWPVVQRLSWAGEGLGVLGFAGGIAELKSCKAGWQQRTWTTCSPIDVPL